MADKPTSKEQRAMERAETQEILNSFRMNIDDTVMKIARKKAGLPDDAPSGGASSLIDKDNSYIAGKKIANEHLDWNSVLEKLGKAPQPKSRTAKATGSNPYAAPRAENTISLILQDRAADQFQPVVEELSRFKFASAPDKREEQLQALLAGVRGAIHKVATQEVANNTKRYYENALKFSRLDDGMLVVFAMGNKRVAVTAQGEFFGDEIICLEQEGQSARAYVARHGDETFADLSENYALKLELVK
jgi:hypothetical protein